MRGNGLVALLGVVGCAGSLVPPVPAEPRRDLVINAPVDKTWDAVIETFARAVIPVETLDRSSGFLVASQAVIPLRTEKEMDAALALADCGRVAATLTRPTVIVYPVSAKYNVLVRPQGLNASTILVSAKFLGRAGADPQMPLVNCESNGNFESDLQETVKRLAELARG